MLVDTVISFIKRPAYGLKTLNIWYDLASYLDDEMSAID